MKKRTHNNEERRQWILNDEGLYTWQRRSGNSMKQFIRENRTEIDKAIDNMMDGTKPQHYLRYGPLGSRTHENV